MRVKHKRIQEHIVLDANFVHCNCSLMLSRYFSLATGKTMSKVACTTGFLPMVDSYWGHKLLAWHKEIMTLVTLSICTTGYFLLV